MGWEKVDVDGEDIDGAYVDDVEVDGPDSRADGVDASAYGKADAGKIEYSHARSTPY